MIDLKPRIRILLKKMEEHPSPVTTKWCGGNFGIDTVYTWLTWDDDDFTGATARSTMIISNQLWKELHDDR